MAKSERQQVINKAYHLLQVFDYDFIKKKDIVPLESGHNAAGTLDYILVYANPIGYSLQYKFTHEAFGGWKMETIMENKEVA